MVEHLRDFDLINQSLFAVLLRKGGLFAESLDCHFFLISQINSEIDCGEVAFAQALLGLEEFMKIELVHELLEF